MRLGARGIAAAIERRAKNQSRDYKPSLCVCTYLFVNYVHVIHRRVVW
jgi:hypothetical protein